MIQLVIFAQSSMTADNGIFFKYVINYVTSKIVYILYFIVFSNSTMYHSEMVSNYFFLQFEFVWLFVQICEFGGVLDFINFI